MYCDGDDLSTKTKNQHKPTITPTKIPKKPKQLSSLVNASPVDALRARSVQEVAATKEEPPRDDSRSTSRERERRENMRAARNSKLVLGDL